LDRAALQGSAQPNDLLGLRSAVTFFEDELDPLARGQRLEAIPLDGGVVDEYLLSLIGLNEAVPF
jgi:hypothetical protein